MAEEQKMNVIKAPTRADFKPLTKVANLKELFQHPDFASRIAAAAPKHFNAERLLRTMVQATNKTPKLNEVAPMSMLGACITIAALGLEPNTPLQYAHLIPFEVNKWNKETRTREYVRTDVQVIIGYQGYLELIYRNDKIKSVECEVFYEDDIKSGRFKYSRGSKRELVHNIDPSIVRDPATPIAGAYMFVELQNGGTVFEVMSLADLHRSRARSQGYQAAMFAYEQAVKANKDPNKDKRYADAPWIKDFIQMCKKTVLRIGQKWVPKTIELASALTIDGEAEDVTIDFSTVASADNVFDGTFETVETEQAQIPVDNAPKITVPVDTREKETVGETKAETTKRTRAAAAPKPADDLPPHMQDDPYNPGPGDSGRADEVYPLFNYLGEGDDGPFGPTGDPVEFAKEFARVYAEATPDQRITLAEFNDESIGLSSKASKEAGNIIMQAMRDYPSKAEVKAQASDASQSPGPTDRLVEEQYDIPRTKTPKGGWDVVEWTKRAKAVLATCPTLEAISTMMDVNFDSIRALPATARTIFDNYVEDRRRIISPTEPEDDEIPSFDEDEVPMPGEAAPELQVEAQKPQVVPPKDEWDRLHDNLEDQINRSTSLTDLKMMSANAAVRSQLKSLKEKRPDLVDDLNKKYAAKETALKG
jgi:recombination protein RecT